MSRNELDDDKLRILTYLAKTLVSCSFCHDLPKSLFNLEIIDGQPNPGDFVLAASSGIHRWTFGFVHEVVDQNTVVVREIGGTALCRIENERFYTIRNFNNEIFLEGEQYRFYKKVLKAIKQIDDYSRRYGGIRFDGNLVTVKVRNYCFSHPQPLKTDDEITIKWNKRMSVKKIADALIEAGFLSKNRILN